MHSTHTNTIVPLHTKMYSFNSHQHFHMSGRYMGVYGNLCAPAPAPRAQFRPYHCPASGSAGAMRLYFIFIFVFVHVDVVNLSAVVCPNGRSHQRIVWIKLILNHCDPNLSCQLFHVRSSKSVQCLGHPARVCGLCGLCELIFITLFARRRRRRPVPRLLLSFEKFIKRVHKISHALKL